MEIRKGPTLVVMAAGMGNRFGGLKQIEPIDETGHMLMDYSIHDAADAGFGQVLMIIRKDFEREFRDAVGRRIERVLDVEYAFQEIDSLPPGTVVPAGRKKPWGTAHAVWCCRDALDGTSFVTINADDYYGEEAYRLAYRFLTHPGTDGEHGVIGYALNATLSRNGAVTRGICVVDAHGQLVRIDEIKRIRPGVDGGCVHQKAEGEKWEPIDGGALVSMNMWAFRPGFLRDLSEVFVPGLRLGILRRPLDYEETLSEAVESMLERNAGRVHVLPTGGKWIGMTYREDKEEVMRGISRLSEDGRYCDMI